jgi:hypothetical protein
MKLRRVEMSATPRRSLPRFQPHAFLEQLSDWLKRQSR